MISRVTSQTLAQSALRNLQSGLNDLSRLQNQATSQRAFAAPSDDPAAASAALDLHAAQHRNAQYARNIGDGLTWVTTVDNAISASTSLLGRARDLTLRGANSGALDANAREAIALELETIADELFAQANTTLLGRSVFAGTTEGSAFADDFTFAGVPGSEVRRRVADGETVRVDASGAEVFGSGDGSVFALIGSIVADLRGGADVRGRIDQIDDRMNAMLGVQGTVGARQNQIMRAKDAAADATVSLEAQRAAVEDIDTVEVLVALKSQELVYQSALAVTARVMQPTLMDFLR
ncbi:MULTISPECIES: flagellin [Microbacterium]|jgi:flagellar hook-associated protein 3 FlgL|uniref:Flagellin n=1 Tax=Microbacterium paludicola TaxID=300019 RepID=A0ABU1I1G7_9MICO|nr:MULTISPECIES: flagellin [Microbacterium]APF34833.1 flagellar hook-associated protein 3 [Microbacterium paludicola]MDR6167725.1 flagellar hook-associated protein 3 FlgL [Microbacterium paludicola]POX66163.1 flagellar hook-associated protein 3 [Microbacterium sp. Ru50]